MSRLGDGMVGGSTTRVTEGEIDTINDIHDGFRRQGLVRPQADRVLGGVCAGLGRRFGIDPWPARLLFVLILLIIPGSQILIYPLLWLLMPREDGRTVPAAPPAATPA